MLTRTDRSSRSRARGWAAIIMALGVVIAPLTAVTAAQADVVATRAGAPIVPLAPSAIPPEPELLPFTAPLCEFTTGDPSVDADGGPYPNLLLVGGQRLIDYNAGKPVILYANNGRSAWTPSGQYASVPACAVRYSETTGQAESSWIYCTFDRASTCAWTNADGELERGGTVLPGLDEVAPDNRLTLDQQKLQAFIAQYDMPIVAGPNGSGGTVPANTIANNETPTSRSLRQNLIHCIDNPGRESGLVFCANNMSPTTQARILEIIGGDTTTLLTAAATTPEVTPGADGEVVVTTTLAGFSIDLTVTGGTAEVCGGAATLSGSTLVIDSDAPLPAAVTLCVTRADAGDVTVSVAADVPVIENQTFVQSFRYVGDTLCQIFSTVEAGAATPVSSAATVAFADEPVLEPSIGTSLVDAADQDRILAWNGGTVVDTVSYENLEIGVEYTLTGELMDKADGTGTGITGSITFTPTATSGSVDVTFTVPEGYAGTTLVAFEQLYIGTDTTGTPIAVHEDINDAAQTVTVENAPAAEPTIGTSLVDSADQDRILAWNGGTVVDTVSYENLEIGVEYTLTGELMDKADGTGTGITGSTTFTPTATSGSVDVTFTVPEGYAGTTLVAFEQLYVGTDTTGTPIAVHEDINDAAQTVTVSKLPVLQPTPGPKDDHLPITGDALPWLGLGSAGLLLVVGVMLLIARQRREVDV